MQNLKEKVAVVTGGASGIGLGIARALAAEKCHVVIADQNETGARNAAAEISATGVRSIGIACDVTDASSVEKLCEAAWAEFEHVDLVFCNAGVMPSIAGFVDADEKIARWAFEVNYFGTWKTAQAFAKRFIAQGTEAHIINTGSENSLCVPAPMMAGYNASKHAVLSLSEMLRHEMPDFVKVSILCPGMVKTALSASTEKRSAEFGGPEEDQFGGELPLGASPDHIGQQAVKGVMDDEFYIVTHYCIRYMVDERYTEMLNAFDRQTHSDDGSDAWDTRKVMQQVLDQQSSD